jgi:hypothetical protein
MPTAGMLVPETSVHQNNRTARREDEIRRSGKIPAVQAEAITGLIK